MSDKQTIDNQRGEVIFRRKLVQQQIEGQRIFEDEFEKEGIEQILRERMSDTFQRMTKLRNEGLTLSPYLEIGAERGQRSLVMETDLEACGAAIDLSFDMLRSCEYYKDIFNIRMPLRICGDLYNSPLKTESLPFVFCYQTLHHFPDPQPIAEEVHRILMPGGIFYFAEEPFKQGLHLNLYKTNKVFSDKHQNRSVMRKVLDRLFAEYVNNEEEYGIIENDDITIKTWRKTLHEFSVKDVKLRSPGSFTSDLYNPGFSFSFFFNRLWGGDISGICRKVGDLIPVEYSILDALTCSVCLQNGQEPDLVREPNTFACLKCGVKYPIVDGVIFLMEPDTLGQLYPEILKVKK